jgi:hypothetical protein
MSVVNLAILLVNVAIVVLVEEDAVAVVHLDFVGVQVMGEGRVCSYFLLPPMVDRLGFICSDKKISL